MPCFNGGDLAFKVKARGEVEQELDVRLGDFPGGDVEFGRGGRRGYQRHGCGENVHGRVAAGGVAGMRHVVHAGVFEAGE